MLSFLVYFQKQLFIISFWILVITESFPSLPQPVWCSGFHKTISVSLSLLYNPLLPFAHSSYFPCSRSNCRLSNLFWLFPVPLSLCLLLLWKLLPTYWFLSILPDFSLHNFDTVLLPDHLPDHLYIYFFFLWATLQRFCVLALYKHVSINFFPPVLYQTKVIHLKQFKTHH